MLPLIAERRAEIAALCRRFGVRRLTVFGSAARAVDFDPQRSDVDFVVAFERIDGASLKEFLALRDALSAAVGRPVDLVMEGSVRNPFIRASIEAARDERTMHCYIITAYVPDPALWDSDFRTRKPT